MTSTRTAFRGWTTRKKLLGLRALKHKRNEEHGRATSAGDSSCFRSLRTDVDAVPSPLPHGRVAVMPEDGVGRHRRRPERTNRRSSRRRVERPGGRSGSPDGMQTVGDRWSPIAPDCFASSWTLSESLRDGRACVLLHSLWITCEHRHTPVAGKVVGFSRTLQRRCFGAVTPTEGNGKSRSACPRAKDRRGVSLDS